MLSRYCMIMIDEPTALFYIFLELVGKYYSVRILEELRVNNIQ